MVFATEVESVYRFECVHGEEDVRERSQNPNPKDLLDKMCDVEDGGRRVTRGIGKIGLKQHKGYCYHYIASKRERGNVRGLNLEREVR